MPDLAVKLRADTAEFESDMGRAAHVSEREMERMVAKATAAGQLIGQAIGRMANSFAETVRSTIELGDQLSKAAQRTGFTVERLSELEFAAKLSDVGFQQLTTSIGFFEKAMVEAGNENTRVGQLFKALSVDLTQGPQKAFEQTVKAIDSLSDQELKVSAMRALFSKSGDALLPVIGNLEEVTQKAQKLGLVISDSMAKDLERFKDSMTTLEAAQRKWVIAFEPTFAGLATFADKMVEARVSGETFKVTLVEVAKLWVSAWSVIPGLGDAAALAFEKLDNLARRSAVSGKIGPAPGAGPHTEGPIEDPSENVRRALENARTRGGRAGRTPRDPSMSAEQIARHEVQAAEEEARKFAEAWSFVNPMLDKIKEWDRLIAAWGPDTFMGMSLEDAEKWVQNQFAAIDAMNDIEDSTKRVAAGFTADGKAVAEATQKTNEWARQMGLTFSSAFEDAISGGKRFSDVLKGLIADLAKMASRKLITEPLGKAFTDAISGGAGGGFSLAGLSRLFGGGSDAGTFASPNTIGGEIGGAVVADSFGGFIPALASGTPYVRKSGLAFIHEGEAVVPAGQNRGGSIVVAPVINIDSRTDRAEVHSLVVSAVNQAVAAIPDKARRGGSYSSGVRGR